ILFFFGVGNHGGGPTLRFLQVIEELKPKLPFLELKYSSLYDFYKKIIRQKQKIPIFKGELQYTCRGCYTSLIKIKFLNRYAENKLQTAEILSSISYKILNKEYPSLKIEKNWRKILFCQFHDIIAGTSIPKAYEDCLGLIESSIVFSKKLINENLWSISNVISTDNIEGFPVLFFNPTSFEREEVKRISFVQRYGYDFIIPKEIEFFDANNKEIYSQSIEEPNTGRKEYLVKVKIPPYGFNVYWWRPSTQQKKNYNLILKDNIIENQKLLVGIDKEKSGFRVILKEKNIDLFKEYGGIFLVIEDYSNAWGHGYSSFRDVIGKFDILELYNGENGNCMVSIFYKLVYNNSEIHQEVILYDGLPYIEVKGKIFWTEKNKFLKISFPLNLNNCKIYAEIPYGYIERPSDGNENPCQRWVEIIGMKEDEKVGVGFINCGWYGYDFFENELRISALRSPVYASLKDPQKLEKNKFYDFQSYGINEFKYWILPHLGEINSSNVVKYAYFLNNEIEYILPLRKKGYYSPPFSFINVSPENIVLSCIKKEENGDNIIFRLYEAYGEKTDAKIEIFGRKFMIKFDKFEIKTLKFFKKIKKLKEVDLN
ncbi:MAG: glycosyl hydrolase-related protein, partial [bacterium]|nr:glycosyl hydrolase-related protein [bacterium]MDW8163124.1 glycoside hydrolase family 38 C-terminal domain-containing protein [Candidatus Omnitrophota bacterium]